MTLISCSAAFAVRGLVAIRVAEYETRLRPQKLGVKTSDLSTAVRLAFRNTWHDLTLHYLTYPTLVSARPANNDSFHNQLICLLYSQWIFWPSETITKCQFREPKVMSPSCFVWPPVLKSRNIQCWLYVVTMFKTRTNSKHDNIWVWDWSAIKIGE